LIGHPRSLAAQGLTNVLSSAGYRVAGHASTVDALLKMTESLSPEVVLVDSSLVDSDMNLVKQLVEGRELVVAMLIGESRPELLVSDAMEAGVRGCLSFDDPPLQFVAALELLVQGAVVITPACTRFVFRRLQMPSGGIPPAQLSPREAQVALLVGRGATNEEISNELSISIHTVKIHVGSILTKLNLRNRHQIAAYVAHYGLLRDIEVNDKP
jgi:DNA-binding NarL/FixJ family response regulator